ncbi:MAG: hypothetical protein H6577_02845 [Lewinellaceae bacterium]|nr:hypothetical protein [Saprospiraceae bacterium]MCB9337048.1 hypothetical protein [Lewinellaceae bacterium]
MKRLPFLLVAFLAALWILPGCEHELVVPEAPDYIPVDTFIIDTTTINDTVPDLPQDSADYTGVPCDPDTVYFQNTILPLLQSSCAKSGCHDAITHKEGVRMTDYANIKKEVKAGNPSQSKLYKVLFQNGEEKMPPPPEADLTAEQKNLIKKWIEQGALNNECNENYGGCDTTGITYSGFIYPLLANYCTGCHGGPHPSDGLDLTTYEYVKNNALSGELYGAISHDPFYKPMPDGGQQLSACFINKVKAWIDSGMPQ